MWIVGFFLSCACLVLSVLGCFAIHNNYIKKLKIGLFNALFAGVFLSTLLVFLPLHNANSVPTFLGGCRTFFLSLFNAMQVFTIGCDYEFKAENMMQCPQWLMTIYQTWVSTLFVLAPIMTFGFVLSLFKNISAYCRYLFSYFRDVYVFSALNEKSLTLASDIKSNHANAVIVFTDVYDDRDEHVSELLEEAKKIDAICFNKDLLAINFQKHSPGKDIFFFTLGNDETENLNQALKLIEAYKARTLTHIYVFSTKTESELLLTSADKGVVKVRRVNEVQSLINRVLYADGDVIFRSAKEDTDGVKDISAIIVGMGRHGTEMVKALSWFCQMDGYRVTIHAFDKDPLAEEKFSALAPELMSEAYNGVRAEGEAQYSITIHSGIDTASLTFTKAIAQITNATYVMVALGDDDVNINTAVNLRMQFERMKIHPVIHSIVYNSQQKKALEGIKNYRGQTYDIDFIGDLESSCAESVILDSELEAEALQRHLKWGKEEEFWTYEYNYRSSIASAIHFHARIRCGIPGAGKREEELTPAERLVIETLEHRRWNAYMRAEGYIYSGSKEKSSRNDLGKMHHDLVDYASLSEEEKRKDSRVGTK